MEEGQLRQLEEMCSSVYSTTEAAERRRLEESLSGFSTSLELIPQIKFVLEHSQSPYAIHFVTSGLLKLLVNRWNSFSVQLRIEIKNHLLNFLGSQGPNLPPFVINAVLQLLTRLIKLAWFDDSSYHEIVEYIAKFLKVSPKHCLLGLRFLVAFVNEISQLTPGILITDHRKIANSFRDKNLQDIFKISLSTLSELFQSNQLSDTKESSELKNESLELALSCLSFDFLGTNPDDTSDEIGITHIPDSWKNLFVDNFNTPQLFFSIYSASPPPLSSKSLQCLSSIISIRKSLWSPQSRELFLTHFLQAISNILQNRQGMGEIWNFHEMCKLLPSIVSNYHLSSLIALPVYQSWIQHVANFTVDSLSQKKWRVNSLYYLMQFWCLILKSNRYLSKDLASFADVLAPQIFQAFVSSRIQAAEGTEGEGEEGEEEEEEGYR